VAFASPDVALSTKAEKYAFNDATIGSNSRWTLLMRPLFFSAALILVASSNVYATEALSFTGGGYTIQIVIGYMDNPGATDWVSLLRNLLKIEKFDMKKSILVMHF
jgi:hypothetical protein